MKKKQTNLIIITIVILLIGYLIMRKSAAKTNGNLPPKWDGTPRNCCSCTGSNDTCSEFEVNDCSEAGDGYVPADQWQLLCEVRSPQWDGITRSCCSCTGSGDTCGEFEVNDCSEAGGGYVPADQYQLLCTFDR